MIVVFGASPGIGAAAVTRFAREGASVVDAARRTHLLEDVTDAVRRGGGTAHAVTCDVREETDIARTITETVERFSYLDGAFNNAGVSRTAQPLHRIEAGDFDEVMAVNLRGVALCLKHEIAAMLETGRGGAIVNTSSVGSFGGNLTMAPPRPLSITSAAVRQSATANTGAASTRSLPGPLAARCSAHGSPHRTLGPRGPPHPSRSSPSAATWHGWRVPSL